MLLPVLVGGVLANGLDGASGPVQAVAGSGLWAGWLTGLVAVLVPSTVSLTVVRIMAPAIVVATVAAALAGDVTVLDGGAMAAAVIVAGVLYRPTLGLAFVQASAYGEERRLPLRASGLLLRGPIPIAWLVVLSGAGGGPLLLAAKQWVIGAIAVGIGWPIAWASVRALHRLSQRWIVFVPAGAVLHDRITLSDPVLFRRAVIASVGPAPATTDAVDLSGRALGLSLELRLVEDTPLSIVGRHRTPQEVTTRAVLFNPGLPGATLAAAAERGLPVRHA